MLLRYKQLVPFLHATEPLWMNFLLNGEENSKAMSLLELLQHFDEANLQLQRNTCDINLLSVRAMFDQLIAKYPACTAQLHNTATVIHSKDFENAIVKVLDHSENLLTPAEAESIKKFKKIDPDVGEEVVVVPSQTDMRAIVEAAAKKRSRVVSTSAYVDLSMISPTSVAAERLFSKVNYLLGCRRRSMDEETINSLIFLEFNRSLWNIADVDEVLKSIN
jgi:hypothetical protein